MAGLNTGGNRDIESGVEGMHVRGKTSRDVFHCYHAIDVFVLVMLQAAERFEISFRTSPNRSHNTVASR